MYNKTRLREVFNRSIFVHEEYHNCLLRICKDDICVLLSEISRLVKYSPCICGHMLGSHTRDFKGCFFDYNCGCTKYRGMNNE